MCRTDRIENKLLRIHNTGLIWSKYSTFQICCRSCHWKKQEHLHCLFCVPWIQSIPPNPPPFPIWFRVKRTGKQLVWFFRRYSCFIFTKSLPFFLCYFLLWCRGGDSGCTSLCKYFRKRYWTPRQNYQQNSSESTPFLHLRGISSVPDPWHDWYGSGSADLYLWPTDPDLNPAIFVNYL